MLLLALLACGEEKPEGDAFALGFGGPPDCVEAEDWDPGVPSALTAELWLRGDPGEYGRSLPIVQWAGVFTLAEDSAGMVNFQVGDGASATHAFSLMDGVLHHVAGTWDGDRASLWVDGEPVALVDGVATGAEVSDTLRIGCDGVGGAYSGLVDELRLSGGVRYTAAFERPTAPYEVDAETLSLFHFDEGVGDATTDEVQGASATVAGPEWVAWSLTDEAG